ncbi:MAG: acyltransferase domain-containing protein [Burkholderiales bacterium]|jgi:[acyl-carrier-protein] S-malonyltransferase|nr:acyltransferase domain-containing protein [Burkholderiales bacterium]
MTLALLFPGQGVQHPDMLAWVDREPLAQPVLAALAARLGAAWRTRLADPDWATANCHAQPLLTGLSLAAWACLAPRLPQPDAVLGYSVGELPAASAAGAFDIVEALELATMRAAAMDAASTEPAGLIAVHGPVDERFGLDLAIDLGPDRAVLGGSLAALEAATPLLVARGAEVKTLAVRVASHTPRMAPAAATFAGHLAPRAWRPLSSTFIANLDGAGLRRADALKHALAEQIAHTVQWRRTMATLAERRPLCVLEVGPGTTLSRLWAAEHPDVPVRSVDEFRSADAVAAWVGQRLA